MKHLAWASLFGAIASFLWGFVSWMLIGWHVPMTFKDEAAVAAVLKENALEHGFYMLPTMDDTSPGKQQESYARLLAGPYFNGIVRPGKIESWSLGVHMAQSFLRSLLACLVLAWLMSRSRCRGFSGRMAFGTMAGIFVTCASALQSTVWFELPLRDLIVALLDNIIEWSLVGAVFAFVLPEPPKH